MMSQNFSFEIASRFFDLGDLIYSFLITLLLSHLVADNGLVHDTLVWNQLAFGLLIDDRIIYVRNLLQESLSIHIFPVIVCELGFDLIVVEHVVDFNCSSL